jgi:sigma-B regulation protein RsbU (phosphoserine phosphatase)
MDKNNYTIIAVDDSKSILTFIRSILIREGYSVYTAESGFEVLEMIKNVVPDLFICDIMMPGMDGFELCNQLNRNESTASVPVIMLTAQDTLKDKIKGLDSGAVDYVTKPFKPDELKARVRAQLRVKSLQDQLKKKSFELEESQILLLKHIDDLEIANRKIINNQKHIEEALNLAYNVQLELLPQSPPVISGYSFTSCFAPAETVAGDFYDFIKIDKYRTGIAIGDVAGKGIPAALIMVLTKTLLRTEAMKSTSPAEVLQRLNVLLREHHNAPEAVTLFYGILDTRDNSFKFSNGGHEFPFYLSERTTDVCELGVGGPFLGIFPQLLYNEAKLYFTEGDRLLFFTDGVLRSSYDEVPIKTIEKFKQLVYSEKDLPQKDFVRKMFSEEILAGNMKLVRGNRLSSDIDDTTLVIFDVKRPRATDNIAEIVVRNNVKNLSEAREFAYAALAMAGMERGRSFDLVYSIDEAMLNSILHGYKGQGEDKTVTISFRKPQDAGFVEVEIVDNGKGLNPATLNKQKAILKHDLFVSEGRGLVMIESLVDDMIIRKSPSGGTSILLKKSLE